MTIDPRQRRAAPRLNLTGRQWKLYLMGGLGIAYAASLTAIATQPHPDAGQSVKPQAAPVAGLAAAGSGSPAVVWIDQLPVADRPNVVLPPGWVVATASGRTAAGPAPGTAPGGASGPAPARAPQGARRILTRTS
jgi:hypothetical protein